MLIDPGKTAKFHPSWCRNSKKRIIPCIIQGSWRYPLPSFWFLTWIAVITGIVPKMAIRFSSFEFYKSVLATKETGKPNTGGVFIAGLGAGITEAVLVVTPMDVVKIRLQAQHHSMSDPLDVPKYRNAAHAAYTVAKEEGFGALYRGVGLTAVRQGTNQAVNFIVAADKPELFADQPAVDASGTLSYTPAPNANGSATVTVRLHDDGGTDHGGQDTSAAATFTITVKPVNDAELAVLSAVLDKI